MKSKNLTYILGVVVLILLMPFLAMQFTEEVNWTPTDFLVAFILLSSFGLSCIIIPKLIKNKTLSVFLVIVLVLVFILLWIEMAVGIFDSPLAGD